MSKPLNIVIVGAGLYVTGRGSDGYGTIMPAVFEWKRSAPKGEVSIVSTNAQSSAAARERSMELSREMSVMVTPRFYPEGGAYDPHYYKTVFRNVQKPACVIIAVPDILHKEIAAEAIEAGLHTMVVKPLAPTLRDVQTLISLQKKAKVYCAVEFHKRLDWANLKLKDTLARGAIGEPLYFLVEYSQRKSVPSKYFRKWAETTNIFQYLGIHYVDIIYFATGAVPKRSMAIGQKGWLASQSIDAYDSVQAVTEWETHSGAKFTSCIMTHWVDPEATSAVSYQKISVIGTKGRFESDQKKRGITIIADDSGLEEPNPYFSSAYGPSGAVSYRGYGIESVTQFLDDVTGIEEGSRTVEDLEPIRPTFRASVVPTRVLESVNMSLSKNGAWVSCGSTGKTPFDFLKTDLRAAKR